MTANQVAERGLQCLPVGGRELLHRAPRPGLEDVARGRGEVPRVARWLARRPVEAGAAGQDRGVIGAQAEPALAQRSENAVDDFLDVEVEFPARRTGLFGAARLVGDQQVDRGPGGSARMLEGGRRVERGGRRVDLVGVGVVRAPGAGVVEAEVDLADRDGHAVAVAADRIQAAAIGQNLHHPRPIGDDHTVWRSQHPAAARADRCPHRGAVEAPLRLGIFERGLPGFGGTRLAVLTLDRLQREDAGPAVGHAPGRLRPRRGRRSRPCGAGQAADRADRRREQIGAPFESDEGLRIGQHVGRTVERDAANLAVVLVAKRAVPAGRRHAEKRIALAGIPTRTVAAAEPALHDFELLGDAGVVGHEHHAAALRGRLAERCAVRHAATDQPRCAQPRRRCGRHRGTRVGAPDVRVERALERLRVVGVVEVVALRGRRQCHAVAPTAHHLGVDRFAGLRPRRVVGEAAVAALDRVDRLVDGALQRAHVLPELAHDEEAAVLQPGAALAVGVGVGRTAGVERFLRLVRIAHEELAELHLVAVVDRTVPGRVEDRLALAVGIAEMLLHDRRVGGREVARQRLDRQDLHPAFMAGEQGLHMVEQRVARLQRRPLADDRTAHAHLHDRMHARQFDTRRAACRRTPVAGRKAPALRVVATHVAEHAGAGLHAFPELLREEFELFFGQAQGAQAGAGERDVQGRRAHRVRAALRRRQLAAIEHRTEERCGRGRVAKGDQQQTAVGDAGVRRNDAALHVGEPIRLRRGGRQRGQIGPPAGVGLQPGDLLREALAACVEHRLHHVLVDHADELLQQVARSAVQDRAVGERRAGGVDRQVQAVQAMQQHRRPQPLAADLGNRFRRSGGPFDRRPGLVFDGPARMPHRRQFVGQGAGRRFAPQRLVDPQVAQVIDAQRRRRIQVVGLDLHAAHPVGPFVEAVIPRGDVADGVAEDHVEQRADFLPQRSHVRLAAAVEDHRQHQLVGLDHGDANRVDLADPLDRVGERPEVRILVRQRARQVQRAEQTPDPRLVGHRFERRHQAWPQRRQHGQLAGAAERFGLDHEIVVHACSMNSRTAPTRPPHREGRDNRVGTFSWRVVARGARPPVADHLAWGRTGPEAQRAGVSAACRSVVPAWERARTTARPSAD